METLMSFLKDCDIVTILTIILSFWVYNGIMNKKFDKIDTRFEKVDARFDKIDERLWELRTSINRMEGAFYSKDCCMLKQEDPKEKAQ